MAQTQEIPQCPGYCEFCGPGCSHCFGTPLIDVADVGFAPKDEYGVIGGLAFDSSVGKWVCAADYDYEANESNRV